MVEHEGVRRAACLGRRYEYLRVSVILICHDGTHCHRIEVMGIVT